jgi:hypothetical protein
MRARFHSRIRSPFIPVVLRRRQSRRGFSLVFFGVFGLIALTAFVSLGVDIGRVRLARTELQTAADAAALACGSSLQFLPTNGVTKAQDVAIDTAAENTSIDQAGGTGARDDSDVTLVRDEDVQFGIWRDATTTSPADFFPLENSGGRTDERREANAVRVWARRCTTYTNEQGEIVTRNTGVPLIFGPVIGSFTGEANMHATVRLMGGTTGFGFVGLDSVKFNGTTKTDSYHSDTEGYPGADGVPNKNSSVLSNGDITVVGGTQIWGDLHPGPQGAVKPYPLPSNVEVTGYMNPLDEPLSYALPPFTPPATNDNAAGITPPPPGKKVSVDYSPAQDTIFASYAGRTANYVFIASGNKPAWDSKVKTTLDNTNGPITVWLNGDLKNGSQGSIHIKTANFPVTFNVFGNFDTQGQPITNDSVTTPATVKAGILLINMCMKDTSLDIGGGATMGAHIMAPYSDLKFHGNGSGTGMFGWAIGKSLDVAGGFELHYDESLAANVTAYNTKLVE